MTLRRTPMMPRTRPMARTPLKPGSPLTAATPLRAAAVGKSAPRDTIPPKVRKQVTARDPWCRRCGDPGHLHCHHRRPKQAGGDPRAHADCCCNLCRLCPACHVWVHAHRGEAEAEGYLLPAETLLPGSVSVMVRSADGGASLWPSCGGVWLSEAPEVVTG